MLKWYVYVDLPLPQKALLFASVSLFIYVRSPIRRPALTVPNAAIHSCA